MYKLEIVNYSRIPSLAKFKKFSAEYFKCKAQQIKDKTAAAEKLESARKQRILIETKEFQQNEESINIATFARSSPNKKGESIYLRPAFQTFDHWTECAFFTTNEKAQRFFLKTGGPKIDLKNLDPDGDGFACDWDPIIYRQLAIPSD